MLPIRAITLPMTQSIANILILAALGVVAVILFMGLWNMFRGGDGNRSQMLMRARVIAQAVALVILLGVFYLFGRGSGA
ncbi:MAG: twin transmembrane helix small protein [Devosia sp.]